ncbi:MAG: ZIP family metal transporter [Endozoicomonadaceae bacterium]|nr:ZIP family metal transporter [Endozoicomonadaceae bacterium]
MLTLKLICSVIIFISTLAAAIYPFFKRMRNSKKVDFPIGEALGSGIFLGAGLIHMLGDSSRHFMQQGYQYPVGLFLSGVMFLVLLWFEHIGRELYVRKPDHHPSFVHLTVILLSVHSFLEGAALGLSEAYSVLFIILTAIMAHKWAASFALAIQINKSYLTFKNGVILFSIFSIMTPLGVLVGTATITYLENYPLFEPIFMSLAAGTFLYLGTLHGLKRAVMIEKCCDLKHFGFVIIGFLLMSLVGIWC